MKVGQYVDIAACSRLRLETTLPKSRRDEDIVSGSKIRIDAALICHPVAVGAFTAFMLSAAGAFSAFFLLAFVVFLNETLRHASVLISDAARAQIFIGRDRVYFGQRSDRAAPRNGKSGHEAFAKGRRHIAENFQSAG